MFNNLDNFWDGFSDELEKIGVIIKQIAKRVLRKAPVGRARAVPGFTARKRPAGLLPVPGVTRGRRAAPKPAPPKTAKPSVPASIGPGSTASTSKPPPAPAAPKVTGKSATAKKKRTLWGDVKGVGGKGLEAGAQMAPWMVMGRMGGGGPQEPKKNGAYV